jgi:hypothetical protein
MRYAIDKVTWVSEKNAVKALRTLVEIGWVLQLPIKPVKYRLNKDNDTVKPP